MMAKYFFMAAEIVSVCVYACIVLMFHTCGLLLGGIWKVYKKLGGERA